MAKEPLNEHELAELIARYPLPDDVLNQVVNRTQLAAALATTVNTIDKWMTAGMPVLTTGTNGQSYEFDLASCWAWRQAELAAQQQRQSDVEASVMAMRLHLIGGSSGDGIDALPPREKREIYDTQRAYEDFLQARNRLMRRADVVELLDDIFALIRDGVSSLPDKLERDVGLKGKQVDNAIETCDELLVELQGQIARFYDARPERVDHERNTLFDG